LGRFDNLPENFQFENVKCSLGRTNGIWKVEVLATTQKQTQKHLQ